jgi:NADPH:quinone reductase-like Zn-dependent oxidoreductase
MGEGGAVRGRDDGVSGGTLRAAVMDGGERPVYGDFPEPQATAGARVVEVRAAALSGLDRNIARRLHYLKMPDGPFVVGREGVAHDGDRRIYFNVNAPVGPFGSMAERSLIDPKFSFPVPDGVTDDVAAALGNAGLAAWLALSWRARLKPGETVLILGATGVSGLIGVTAARELGAGRVIAAGRNRDALDRAKRLGADVTVDLSARDLIAAYREAAGGAVDVVIDNVNGAPGEAALEVLALNGRLVHVGAMAGLTMTVRGAAIRRTSADILGFAYYHAPVDLQAQAYGELCRLAAVGKIEIDVETHPLSDIGTAWDARAAGNRRRQVLIP